MNSIRFQPYTYPAATVARPAPRFSGLLSFGNKKETAEKAETPANSNVVQGSFMKGISRALRMTFLRPRGWAELVIAIVSHGIVNLPAIHFIQGWVGADSMVMHSRPLHKLLNKSGAIEFGGRSLLDAARDFYHKFLQRKK